MIQEYKDIFHPFQFHIAQTVKAETENTNSGVKAEDERGSNG